MSELDKSSYWLGDSEMAARVLEFDWSATPLGALEGWPQSLRSVVPTVARIAGAHMSVIGAAAGSRTDGEPSP